MSRNELLMTSWSHSCGNFWKKHPFFGKFLEMRGIKGSWWSLTKRGSDNVCTAETYGLWRHSQRLSLHCSRWDQDLQTVQPGILAEYNLCDDNIHWKTEIYLSSSTMFIMVYILLTCNERYWWVSMQGKRGRMNILKGRYMGNMLQVGRGYCLGGGEVRVWKSESVRIMISVRAWQPW